MDASARSLNRLAAVPFVASPALKEISWTNVQNWMMKDLYRRVGLYGADLDADSVMVMADLGHRSSLYEQEARHLAPMDLDRIKILKRRLEPTDAKPLKPPEVIAYLRHV